MKNEFKKSSGGVFQNRPMLRAAWETVKSGPGLLTLAGIGGVQAVHEPSVPLTLLGVGFMGLLIARKYQDIAAYEQMDEQTRRALHAYKNMTRQERKALEHKPDVHKPNDDQHKPGI